VRFHGRRVTKVGPEVKQLPPEGWGPLNKGCERRTWALPDVSGGGERHDRFGVVVGEGVVEPRIEGRFARRVDAAMHAHPLLPEPEMAQDAIPFLEVSRISSPYDCADPRGYAAMSQYVAGVW